MNRRNFLGSGLFLLAGVSASRLAAHDEHLPDYQLPEALMPRQVRISNELDPFEIHVDPAQFALFWTLPKRQAIRYTVGIGRRGLYHAGEYYVCAKRAWPDWKPTPQMIERAPELYTEIAEGMPGGLNNPLGARALYLFQPGRGDTMLRIHGTNDPNTLGRRVSNGCARLVNSQIIELYDQVPVGTRVVLYPTGDALTH